MAGVLVRILILALAGGVAWLAVWSGRRYVEQQRRAALATPSTPSTPSTPFELQPSGAPVRILAFSSAGCTQCHRLQRPALRRVQDALGEATVDVIEIDGPSSPELTKRYNVLTVPTTVVLDAAGNARAINYGFANAQMLLSQVDELLNATRVAS